MLRLVQEHSWDRCEGDAWASISEEAKAVVRGLIAPDYRKRLTATALLQEGWVKLDDGPAKQESSFRLEAGGGIERLSKFRESSKRLLKNDG